MQPDPVHSDVAVSLATNGLANGKGSPPLPPIISMAGVGVNGGAGFVYAQLFAAHSLGRAGIRAKTVQNEKSCLRRLMGFRGETEAADCKWMANQKQYEEALAALTDPGNCKTAPGQSRGNKTLRSGLNQVRRTLITQLALANPGNTLWESYLRAHYKHINTGGTAELMTKTQFIRHCFNATGINRRKLNARKIVVQGPTFERIKQLEDSLGAAGELTQWLINWTNDHMQRFRTAYGKRVAEAVRFQYSLHRADWPDALKQEWDDLFLWRTEPQKAAGKWQLHYKMPKRGRYLWRIRKHERSCPSAAKQQLEASNFFGWCLQPQVPLPNGDKNFWRSGPNRKINKDDLSLALFADSDLFDGYIQFRKAHTVTEAESIAGEMGEFNRSCKTFIEFASSLLNPRMGFIFHRKDLYFRPRDQTPSARNLAPKVGDSFYKPELDKIVYVSDLDERWYWFCKTKRSYMEDLRDLEFDPARKTRDTEAINRILALDDPLAALAELLQKLEEAEPEIEHFKHFHRRKKLFFTLISNCPLRVLQYACMTGRHLVRTEAKPGEKPFYQIRFTKDEFKNERYIAERDYSFDLPSEYTRFIDSYLQEDWPAIVGRAFEKDDRVFQGQLLGQKPLDRKSLTHRIITQLNKICRYTTARHLGEKYCMPGFGPHAVRHIVATGTIKATGSYEDAALLLWDAVQTVRKAYAHIKRVEQLSQASREHYNRVSRALDKARSLYLAQIKRADANQIAGETTIPGTITYGNQGVSGARDGSCREHSAEHLATGGE
jgi:hypothetical protein